MADFAGLYDSIPPVTRTLLICTALITAPCLLQAISPGLVALSWYRVRKFYEVWRPFTAFFFGGGGFPLIYDVFLLYRNSSTLEKDIYNNNTAYYTWMHLVIGCMILLLNILLSHPFLFRPMLYAQTYLWCRSHATTKVSIFGLITIPTSLYPPSLLVLDTVTGGPHKALNGLMGIIAGHAWWFCSTYLPDHAPTSVRRPNPLAMPLRFQALFRSRTRASTTTYGATRLGSGAGTRLGSQAASTSNTTARDNENVVEAMRHRWGSGQRLGGSSL
ncbi:Der1-like family-domain-containing protein [Kockovaella imperatae]|uniref:Derlin n=1 Tax=Kockovaella imperatae TaxID=4999 RepID=A0A1Y1UEB8_9TREE|nr:Der1-like family-domain-containing protein [Kockovaella imperatae]ORX35854.1 Der1-like family-domain-containing protein [Kockovaella imperatae]